MSRKQIADGFHLKFTIGKALWNDLFSVGLPFKYADQQFGVEAHVKAVASGKVYLLRENLEFPFVIEKRIGAEAALGDIRYDRERRALVGELKDVTVDLGENFILQLLNRGAEYLL